MSASIAAAVAATAMICGGENDGLSFLVKIAGTGLGKWPRYCGGKACGDDAMPADAGDVAGVLGNAGEQFGLKDFFGAPAPPLVVVGADKMAFVGTAAERAFAGLAIHARH